MGGAPVDKPTADSTVNQPGGSGELCVAYAAAGGMQEVALPLGAELSIGRGSACDVRINDRSVSRHHALVRRGDEIEIKDLGSSNGVYVSGDRIPANEWQLLMPGEPVTFGAGFLIVRTQTLTARPRRIWAHGYFAGRVEEECERGRRTGGEFAVLRFRSPARVAQEQVENALADCARASDVIARYAPGEFEVMLLDLPGEEVEAATQRLVAGLAAALSVDASEFITGCGRFPLDERSPDKLLARAHETLRGRHGADESRTIQPAHVREQILRIADSHVSVLVLGETGVGKEVCVEQIHRLSARSERKLLRLNCAALSATLLESELFGFEKGAFTGATRSKPGLFESADGGTVFLDEVGEIPASTQVKLLRVLEERKVQRIGALEPVPIDVRFVAATNRDLEEEVAAGRFRQDLMFRINTFVLYVPPLRERRDEIEPLARHFAAQSASELGQELAPRITTAFIDELLRYPWPGNIRELRNVMERAQVLAAGEPLEPQHLPLDKMHATIARSRPGGARARATPPTPQVEEHPTLPEPSRPVQPLDAPEQAERQRIMDALDACAGNQTRAAKMLGMSRYRLMLRLDKLGIARPRKK